jgi:hypothetical protein
MVAARAADRLLDAARERGDARWVAYLEPLPDRLRDAELADLRKAAMQVRAAFGPKDSVRDAYAATLTEPLLEAVDRLLKALNRRDAAGDRA